MLAFLFFIIVQTIAEKTLPLNIYSHQTYPLLKVNVISPDQICTNETRIVFTLAYNELVHGYPVAIQIRNFSSNLPFVKVTNIRPSYDILNNMPQEICSSFVGIGQSNNDIDCTTLAPDYKMNATHVKGSWYCIDPTSPQIHVDSVQQTSFFIMQLAVNQPKNHLIDISLGITIYSLMDPHRQLIWDTFVSTDLPTPPPPPPPTNYQSSEGDILLIIFLTLGGISLISLFIIFIGFPFIVYVLNKRKTHSDPKNGSTLDLSTLNSSTGDTNIRIDTEEIVDFT